MNNDQFLKILAKSRMNNSDNDSTPINNLNYISDMQNALKPQPKNMLGTIGDIVSDFNAHMNRGSIDETRRQYGASLETSQERFEKEEAKRMQILKFLQDAEEAKKLQEYRYAELEERKKHNSMMMNRMSSEDRRGQKEEILSKLREDYQSKNPGSKYLHGLAPSERSQYLKQQLAFTKGGPSLVEAEKTIDELIAVVEKYPIVSKYLPSIMNEEAKGGKGLFSKLYNWNLSDEDREGIALFQNYRNKLTKHEIEGLAGAKINMFLEKMAAESVGKQGSPRSALIKNLSGMKKTIRSASRAHSRVADDIINDVYNPNSFYGQDEEEEQPQQQNTQQNAPAYNNTFKGGDILINMPDGSVQKIPRNTPKHIIDEIVRVQAGGR